MAHGADDGVVLSNGVKCSERSANHATRQPIICLSIRHGWVCCWII